jgi:hypothetical protein
MQLKFIKNIAGSIPYRVWKKREKNKIKIKLSQNMSRRYNTRSQSNKIISVTPNVSQECIIEIEPERTQEIVPAKPTDKKENTECMEDVYLECLTIESFVKNANLQIDRCKRLSITLQMYHYLEHHHLYMKVSPKFKETIRSKIAEYCTVAQMEEEAFQIMRESYTGHLDIPENVEKYLKQHEIVILCQLIRESCMRLQNVIETF